MPPETTADSEEVVLAVPLRAQTCGQAPRLEHAARNVRIVAIDDGCFEEVPTLVRTRVPRGAKRTTVTCGGQTFVCTRPTPQEEPAQEEPPVLVRPDDKPGVTLGASHALAVEGAGAGAGLSSLCLDMDVPTEMTFSSAPLTGWFAEDLDLDSRFSTIELFGETGFGLLRASYGRFDFRQTGCLVVEDGRGNFVQEEAHRDGEGWIAQLAIEYPLLRVEAVATPAWSLGFDLNVQAGLGYASAHLGDVESPTQGAFGASDAASSFIGTLGVSARVRCRIGRGFGMTAGVFTSTGGALAGGLDFDCAHGGYAGVEFLW